MTRPIVATNQVIRERSGTPEAEVVDVRGARATIRCPLCGHTHVHETRKPGRQWFAPACGWTRTPEQRAAGYTFFTTRR